jgi:ribosomal protein S18 acetylase RimI-like enzyme
MIRKANERDCERLCELSDQYLKILNETRPEMTSNDQPLGQDREFFLDALKKKNETIYVKEEEGEVVGFVYAVLWRNRPDDLVSLPYIEVVQLLVDEGQREKGIGLALMDRIHDWGKEKGIRIFHLQVHEFNQEAIHFYEKQDYRTIMRLMEKKM